MAWHLTEKEMEVRRINKSSSTKSLSTDENQHVGWKLHLKFLFLAYQHFMVASGFPSLSAAPFFSLYLVYFFINFLQVFLLPLKF